MCERGWTPFGPQAGLKFPSHSGDKRKDVVDAQSKTQRREKNIVMARIEASVVVDRPVEDVWKFISDLSNNGPKWNPGVLEVKQTSAGPLGVGTTLRRSGSTRPYLATSRVTEYEPGQKITLEVTSPQTIRGTIESLGLENIEGKTKLNSVWELKINGFYRLIGPFQVGNVRKFNEARISNVKHILESEARS